MPAKQTGPKTTAGKARASRNAVKHGITSQIRVIPGMESEEEWEQHHQCFLDYFAPQGAFEEYLVERLVGIAWCQKRATRYENALVLRQIVAAGVAPLIEVAYANALAAPLEVDEEDEEDEEGDHEGDDDEGEDGDEYDDDEEEAEDDRPGHRASRELHISLLREMYLLPSEEKREHIMRYQGFLLRTFNQTLHELEALQARRNGRPAFLGRFDVTASPS